MKIKIYPSIITIGSSDNIGGAGVQVDLKTFADFNCYGANVITNVTAQSYSNKELFSYQKIDLDNVSKQFDYIINEFPIDTIKTGMIFNIETIKLISEKIEQHKSKLKNIVVDPILTNNSGKVLFGQEIIDSIKNHLVKLATVITPNLKEFKILFNSKVNNVQEIQKTLNCDAIIKYGNIESKNTMIDYCFSEEKVLKLEKNKLNKKNIRGDGCRLAAAITALLSRGYSFLDASKIAKEYVWNAINNNQVLSQEI